jgi:hypothetical protein
MSSEGVSTPVDKEKKPQIIIVMMVVRVAPPNQQQVWLQQQNLAPPHSPQPAGACGSSPAGVHHGVHWLGPGCACMGGPPVQQHLQGSRNSLMGGWDVVQRVARRGGGVVSCEVRGRMHGRFPCMPAQIEAQGRPTNRRENLNEHVSCISQCQGVWCGPSWCETALVLVLHSNGWGILDGTKRVPPT